MKLRAATIDDRTFVVSTWLDSYRDSKWAGPISMVDWYPVMWPVIEKVLDRPTVSTVVADIDDVTVGFLCAELDHARPRSRRHNPPIVHYCYVKEPYRRWAPSPGVATRLFEALGIDPTQSFDYTFRTAAVDRLADAEKIPFASHRPLLVRFPPGKGYRR